MLSAPNSTKSGQSAGILALTLTEEYRFAPHHFLVDLERSHISSLVQKSFSGLADLSQRAAKTVEAFQELQKVLREGKEYFFGGPASVDSFIGPTLMIRQAFYQIGKEEGFDRCARRVEKRPGTTFNIEGRSLQKTEVLEILQRCKALELRRAHGARILSAGMSDCAQRVIKDRHLLHSLCAVAGISNTQEFEQLRRVETIRSTQSLLEWERRATSADRAFQTELNFDGWITAVAAHHATLSQAARDTKQPCIALGNAMMPQRKHILSAVVVRLLDDFAVMARKLLSLPESPVKDILRVHFLVTELQKSLPVDVAQQHREKLEFFTTRLLDQPDHGEYLAALDKDNLLSEEDKNLLLRHFVLAQSKRSTSAMSHQQVHPTGEKRSEIRRQIRASLERDKIDLGLQEIFARVSELRESAPEPKPQADNPVKFFPSRLEQDFDKWLADFPVFIQEGLRDLVKNAAKGVTVDSKPIRRETKITELRFAGAGGIRIYVARLSGGDFYVLAFGSKKSQDQDIQTAIDRLRGL